MTVISDRSPERLLPIFVWCLIQSVALTVAALRVPLWAAAPVTGEFAAVQVLLVAQILAAAMLCPKLLADYRLALLAIASIWPFMTLAVLLSARPLGDVWMLGGYCSAWLAALTLITAPLPPTLGSRWVAMGAATWAAAGPILDFLSREYAGAAGNTALAAGRQHIFDQALRGPLSNALQFAGTDHSGAESWAAVLLAAGMGLAVLIATAAVRIHRRMPTAPTAA